MKRIWVIISLMCFSSTAFAAVVTKDVEYTDGDTVLQGYIAYDEAVSVTRPGIIIVHEWKGLDDYVKSRAKQLAELGYVAFAIDMYGKGIYAKDHQEAAKLSGVFRNDRNLMRERALAGLNKLKSFVFVDQSRIAAIGYCFGGTAVLEMARAGYDLDGVTSFHGNLSTPIPAGSGDIKAKVLVLHGDADPHTNKSEDIEVFKQEMRTSGADWEFVVFGGAMHAFTVPTANMPDAGQMYDPKADARSWKILQDFFTEIF